MHNINARTVLCCVVSFAAFIITCAHDTASLKVEKSLSAEKLARYNDSFDSLREDVWEKLGYINKASNRPNFKQGDLSIETGRLKVETKKGSFSFGGIVSKFFYSRDFDVQVDCYVDFLKGINDMDQVIVFLAADKTKEMEDDKMEVVYLGLRKSGKNSAFIFGGYQEKGIVHTRYSKEIDDFFKGTLRIVRIGNQVSLQYATTPGGEWQKACSFSRSSNDTLIALRVANFFPTRGSIGANSPFTVYFDNFKINAAQEIIEDEI